MIDPVVINHSSFIYVRARWEAQLERNRQRRSDGLPHPPDELMQEMYSDDDINEISKIHPFSVIENNGSVDEFVATINDTVSKRIQKLLIG